MDISLSTSAFNDAARCLKRYEYRWVEGLVPKPRDVRPVLRRGIWIHRCLELADKGQDWKVELGHLWQWAVEQGVEQKDADETYTETLELVEDYLAYWAGHEEETWTLVGTEVQVEWSPKPGLLLTATIDCLKQDARGRLWIWERKSTQEIPDSDWRTVDPQTMLQFVLARQQGMDIAGIVFDYICTRPGRVPRVTQHGKIYQSDEEVQTRARHFAKTEAELRKHRQGETYIDLFRSRMVADGLWFQRYVTLRPDDNALATLKDVAQVVRYIKSASEAGYFPRSINVLDCRLFCPYGKLCMAEYRLGRKSEAYRDEYTTAATQEQWDQGRTAA